MSTPVVAAPRRIVVVLVARLLNAEQPREALAALRKTAGTSETFESELGAAVEQAVAGIAPAVDRYVRGWDGLVRSTLAALRVVHPEFSSQGSAKDLHLLWGALDAPFSGWVAEHGTGQGVVLSFVERLRTLVPGSRSLAEPPLALTGRPLSDEDFLRFHTRVEAALRAMVGSTADLERTRVLFDLNLTELAELFGATRQATTKWFHEGLPRSRRPKAATVVAIGELLERKLRPGRVPAIARRPAHAYGGRSMLDRIGADEHEELLEEVRASFDWAATA